MTLHSFTRWHYFFAAFSMQHRKWHIGLSGFSYREWKGTFYPSTLAQKDWFAFYAQHFNTIEINNTFYRFPEQKLFDNWYLKSQPGFTFSIKVPQIITHRQRFRETQTLLHDFYSVARQGLKEKLGAILFQLPPSLKYDENLLSTIIGQLDSQFHNVLEFRHASWWREDVFDALKKANVIFCGVSYPDLPSESITDLPLTYFRFHGVPRLYYSRYNEAFIQRIAAQITGSGVSEAYVYFNNTADGAAIENARYLQQLAGANDQPTDR